MVTVKLLCAVVKAGGICRITKEYPHAAYALDNAKDAAWEIEWFKNGAYVRNTQAYYLGFPKDYNGAKPGHVFRVAVKASKCADLEEIADPLGAPVAPTEPVTPAYDDVVITLLSADVKAGEQYIVKHSSRAKSWDLWRSGKTAYTWVVEPFDKPANYWPDGTTVSVYKAPASTSYSAQATLRRFAPVTAKVEASPAAGSGSVAPFGPEDTLYATICDVIACRNLKHYTGNYDDDRNKYCPAHGGPALTEADLGIPIYATAPLDSITVPTTGAEHMNGQVYNGHVVVTKIVAQGEGVTTGVSISEIVYSSSEPFIAANTEMAKAILLAEAIAAGLVEPYDPRVTVEVVLK